MALRSVAFRRRPVRTTLEEALEEAPRDLRKKYDPASGLMLIDLEA